MIRLIDVADVIRSKNSGPYELTFDILFKDPAMFETFCRRNLMTKELIANLYRIPLDKVLNLVQFKPAKALKFTIQRPIPSGALGDTDIYGAQQHAPLLDLKFDEE